MSKLSNLISQIQSNADGIKGIVDVFKNTAGIDLNGVLTKDELKVIIATLAKLRFPSVPSFVIGIVLRLVDPAMNWIVENYNKIAAEVLEFVEGFIDLKNKKA